MLFLVGGLIQINPIWEWGPFHTYLSENGAQPDWYVGWLIGALRLMPNWEPAIGSHTVIPDPFWGGVAFPLFVFGVLFAWPSLDRRLSGDKRRHDLLDRPRDPPFRTAAAAAFLSWVGLIFFIGASDRIYYRLAVSYTAQIHFWRVAVWIVPVIVFFAPAISVERCSDRAVIRCAGGRGRSSRGAPTERSCSWLGFGGRASARYRSTGRDDPWKGVMTQPVATVGASIRARC